MREEGRDRQRGDSDTFPKAKHCMSGLEWSVYEMEDVTDTCFKKEERITDLITSYSLLLTLLMFNIIIKLFSFTYFSVCFTTVSSDRRRPNKPQHKLNQQEN